MKRTKQVVGTTLGLAVLGLTLAEVSPREEPASSMELIRVETPTVAPRQSPAAPLPGATAAEPAETPLVETPLTEERVLELIREATAMSPEARKSLEETRKKLREMLNKSEERKRRIDQWPQTDLEPVERGGAQEAGGWVSASREGEVVWHETWKQAWWGADDKRTLILLTDPEICAPCRLLEETLDHPAVKKELARYFSCAKNTTRRRLEMGMAEDSQPMPILWFLPHELPEDETVMGVNNFDPTDVAGFLKLLKENR